MNMERIFKKFKKLAAHNQILFAGGIGLCIGAMGTGNFGLFIIGAASCYFGYTETI